eukprot:scaffold1794_cov107-Cylindrotheca_fusiformis.AAC.6
MCKIRAGRGRGSSRSNESTQPGQKDIEESPPKVRTMKMADRGLVVIKFESSYGVRLDDYQRWRKRRSRCLTNLRN